MSTKRANGEGVLRKRKNGLWECTVMDGFQKNGKRNYKSFYGRTQKEAREKAAIYFSIKPNQNSSPGLIVSCQTDDIPAIRFCDWADQWYVEYEDEVAPSTYDNYQYTLNRIKEYFAGCNLSDIKALDVERFLKSLIQSGKSKSLVSKSRGMLFQIMQKAEANSYITKNPVPLVKKLRMQKTRSRKDSFTVSEVRDLLKHLPDDMIGNAIRLMLCTGLRTQ